MTGVYFFLGIWGPVAVIIIMATLTDCERDKPTPSFMRQLFALALFWPITVPVFVAFKAFMLGKWMVSDLWPIPAVNDKAGYRDSAIKK